MAIDITMPALSPTMEVGTLSRWLVKPGDMVKAGDLIAEIETDKATMEVEAVDEGVVSELLVADGTEDIKVNAVIARLAAEGEAVSPAPKAAAAPVLAPVSRPTAVGAASAPAPAPIAAVVAPATVAPAGPAGRHIASPLARRVAQLSGVDLATVRGTGPHGRIVKTDVELATRTAPEAAPVAVVVPLAPAVPATDVPFEAVKLSSMRKTIARRLTESKQQVPHYYLTVDIRLDALLALRGDLNKVLEVRGIKLSVNDMLVKAQALALLRVPDANVSYAGDSLRKYSRADISVAVAIPGGLITPVIRDAANKPLAAIASEMKDLAARAKAGKLQPPEYTGGTASISNLGMFGVKQFDAVINPPEGMILAVGAGEKRPWVEDDRLVVATVISATGSFDHRAIDGSVGAELMRAFKELVEAPLGMLV